MDGVRQEPGKEEYKNLPRSDPPFKPTTVPLPVRQTSVPDTAEHSSSHSKKKQALAAGIATLGCILNGTSIGYTGTAIPSLMNGTNIYQSPMNLNQQEISWITSLLSLGCFFGGLMSGYVMEKLGRKKTLLIVTSSSFFMGYLLIYLASSVEMICIGRFISGIGLGLELSVATVYVVEIASADMRRVLGHFVQFMGSLGVLFSFVMGSLFFEWYTLALINGLFLIPFVIGMLFIPESPHWLIHRGHEYQASESLEWLRGRDDAAIDREIEKIKRHVLLKQKERSAGIGHLKDSIKPFIVCLGMMFFMVFSGFNIFIFYSVTIFETAGCSVRPASSVIIVGLVLLLSCIVSLFVASQTKRKWIMVCSMLLMGVFHSILGLFMYLYEVHKGNSYEGAIGKHIFSLVSENRTLISSSEIDHLYLTMDETVGSSTGWIPLFCIVCIIFIGNVGYGTLIWIVTTELMPPKARSVCNSVLISTAFLCGFIVTKTFVDLVEGVKESGAFWIYAGISFLGGLFTLVFTPETKGKTQEEIRQFYYRRPQYKAPHHKYDGENGTQLEVVA